MSVWPDGLSTASLTASVRACTALCSESLLSPPPRRARAASATRRAFSARVASSWRSAASARARVAVRSSVSRPSARETGGAAGRPRRRPPGAAASASEMKASVICMSGFARSSVHSLGQSGRTASSAARRPCSAVKSTCPTTEWRHTALTRSRQNTHRFLRLLMLYSQLSESCAARNVRSDHGDMRTSSSVHMPSTSSWLRSSPGWTASHRRIWM
mmetsp:Transcript_17405/g.52076  ORF Transcript_17405/g.52076 Transcript_17405/m.52076 type:complete len:216 (+) Transcript_17405:1494-2141(+)